MASEKSELEKIEVCRRFLEKRGFLVERLLTPEQLAQLLQCSEMHAKSLDIPYINIGRARGGNIRRRYPAQDVSDWIEQRRSRNEAPPPL